MTMPSGKSSWPSSRAAKDDRSFRPDGERGRILRSRVASVVRRGTAVAVAGLVVLTGCSSGDDAPAGEAATSKPAGAPAAGLESFCDEFADVLVQDDPDFSRLVASAPEEVKPEVEEVVEFSEMASTAEEAPAEDVIDGFQRSLAGMTIYALGNCDDAEQLATDLGLDEEQLEVARSYSLEDVRDDDTWPEVQAALDP